MLMVVRALIKLKLEVLLQNYHPACVNHPQLLLYEPKYQIVLKGHWLGLLSDTFTYNLMHINITFQ